MNFLQNLPAFIASIYLLAMIPGQGTAMVLRQTLLFGTKIGSLTVLSYTFGFAIWGALSAVGLAGIFIQSPTAYAILKYVGVAYLLFLSFQVFMQLSKAHLSLIFQSWINPSKPPPLRQVLLPALPMQRLR